jgi:hypothetical protein
MESARIVAPLLGPESVFVVGINNENAVLTPGQVVEWSLGTNATNPTGAAFELVDSAVNLTTGIGVCVAGAVHTTISTNDVGLLQVYGYKSNVRSSASVASGRMVVASSINATNIGAVDLASQSTLTGPEYDGAVVGWLVDNSANATTAKVFLKCL